MTILVTGATGQIGSLVVERLAARGASARLLSTDPAKHEFPAGMKPVRGNLLDPPSLRAALDGAGTLFLMNAVSADELTKALLALDLAREAWSYAGFWVTGAVRRRGRTGVWWLRSRP